MLLHWRATLVSRTIHDLSIWNKPSSTWSMLSSQPFYPNMEDRSHASSNEFCSSHRMNIAWIIEWILFESSNEYCLNCFINVGENRMHIKANLWNFATSRSNVLNKIKYIWILLSICGNYQTHIRDIEYWHISATIVHNSDNRNIKTKTA